MVLIGNSPTQCFDKVFEDCGGIMSAESCGSLPRNKKQIANVKLLSKQKCDDRDPLFAIIQKCKQEDSQCDPFIRNVQGAPDDMCVLAKPIQLEHLVKFCCD